MYAVKKELDDNDRRSRHGILNYGTVGFVPSALLKINFTFSQMNFNFISPA